MLLINTRQSLYYYGLFTTKIVLFVFLFKVWKNLEGLSGMRVLVGVFAVLFLIPKPLLF